MKLEDEKSKKFVYEVAEAYLEMARALRGAAILRPEGTVESDMTMTNNTLFALVAHGYLFAVSAVSAYVNASLWKVWTLPNSQLKAKYPNFKEFTPLLKHFRSQEKCIKELCLVLNIKTLSAAQPKLWNDWVNGVKLTRNFLIHPTPVFDDFNKIVGDAIESNPWERPSRTAEQVIGYFYVAQNQPLPIWLQKNTEFRFETIRALSVQPRPNTEA